MQRGTCNLIRLIIGTSHIEITKDSLAVFGFLMLLVFRPPDAILCFTSVFFNHLTFNPHSGATAEVYHRLNLFNSFIHFSHPSHNFYGGDKVPDLASIFNPNVYKWSKVSEI